MFGFNSVNVYYRSKRSVLRRQSRDVFLSDERPTLETLDFTIRIGSTPTFLYFDLYIIEGSTWNSLFSYTLHLLKN